MRKFRPGFGGAELPERNVSMKDLNGDHNLFQKVPRTTFHRRLYTSFLAEGILLTRSRSFLWGPKFLFLLSTNLGVNHGNVEIYIEFYAWRQVNALITNFENKVYGFVCIIKDVPKIMQGMNLIENTVFSLDYVIFYWIIKYIG